MKLKKLLLLLVLSLIIAGCGGTQQTPTLTGDPNVSIEIQMVGLESQEIGTEIISQPNCTGVAEVANQLEKSRTITYVIEVQNGMSVNANGTVGFAGTGVELGATVAAEFGQSYGTSETISRSITVGAQPGTNMQHVIRQMEIWKTGEAKVTVGGQQAIIPFKFRSDFAIELVGSNPVPCETPTGGSTDTPMEITPASVGLPVGMDVQLITDKTSGKHPLSVSFDARGSFLRDANGDIYPCGVCNFTWYVYQNSQLINDPQRSSRGTFSYKFGKSGDYRVVVRVCRGQEDSDCGFDGENISVQ